MFVYNQKLVESNRGHAAHWKGLNQQRSRHELLARNHLKAQGISLSNNEAALIPRDAYRDLDRETTRAYENDEGRGYMSDLMDISKPIHIGKTVSQYRTATDKSGIVETSISGQVSTVMSKTEYDYKGDPVPIFTTGYGREWRQNEGFISEGFDAMTDDQYNSSRDILERMAIYMLYGDSGIVVKGFQAFGITNHPNTNKLDLGAAGANIDLTTATADEMVAYFQGPYAKALDANYVERCSSTYVSPQIMRNMDKVYSGATDFKEGTVKDYVERYCRTGAIRSTFELGREGPGTGAYDFDGAGNEFFSYVKDQSALCPLVAAPVSTIAIPQLLPMDDDNTLVWSAMGMRIKSDANNRSKVFFGSEIS